MVTAGGAVVAEVVTLAAPTAPVGGVVAGWAGAAVPGETTGPGGAPGGAVGTTVTAAGPTNVAEVER